MCSVGLPGEIRCYGHTLCVYCVDWWNYKAIKGDTKLVRVLGRKIWREWVLEALNLRLRLIHWDSLSKSEFKEAVVTRRNVGWKYWGDLKKSGAIDFRVVSVWVHLAIWWRKNIDDKNEEERGRQNRTPRDTTADTRSVLLHKGWGVSRHESTGLWRWLMFEPQP